MEVVLTNVLLRIYPMGILCCRNSKLNNLCWHWKICESPQSVLVQAMPSSPISFLIIGFCITAAVLHIIDALRRIWHTEPPDESKKHLKNTQYAEFLLLCHDKKINLFPDLLTGALTLKDHFYSPYNLFSCIPFFFHTRQRL